MRLKRIYLEKFGLFKNFSYDFKDISLFFGYNESGKTTLIDSILWALYGFRGPWKDECKIRYSANPAATLMLDYEGARKELSGKIDFAKVCGIPTVYFMNIFCVRAGEVLLQGLDRKGWQETMAERILGIKGNVGDVLEELRAQAGRKPEGEKESRFDVWRGLSEIEERIETLNIQKEGAEELAGELLCKKTLGGELTGFRKKKQEINQELERFKRARDKKRLEEIELREKSIGQRREELKRYEHLGEEDLKKWEELEKQKEDVNREGRFKETQCRQELEEQKGLSDTADPLSKEVREWRSKAAVIHSLSANAKSSAASKKLFYSVGVVFALAGLLLWVLFRAQRFLILCLGLPVCLFSLKIYLSGLSKRIKGVLKHFGPEWEGVKVGELAERIEQKEGEIKRKEGGLGTSDEQLGKAKERVEQLNTALTQIKQRGEMIGEEIEKLKESTGIGSLPRFREDILEKKKAGIELNSFLTGRDEKEIEKEKRELSGRLKGQSVKSEDWNEERYNSLKKELERVEEKETKKAEDIHSLELAAAGIEGRLGGKEGLDVMLELDKEKQNLEEFKLNMDAAWLAYGMLKEVEAETNLIVKETIGDNASKMFSRFTGNRYRKILVKSLGLSELAVELKSGEEKPLEWLSSGTKAQLYLAIRFALAEKSLPGQKGFLLLDEPFLGCDEQRVSNLVDALFSFARDKGWQLIFFTLDRSLKELFEKKGIKAKVLEVK